MPARAHTCPRTRLPGRPARGGPAFPRVPSAGGKGLWEPRGGGGVRSHPRTPAGAHGRCGRLCKRAPRLGVNGRSQHAAETLSAALRKRGNRDGWGLGSSLSLKPIPSISTIPTGQDPCPASLSGNFTRRSEPSQAPSWLRVGVAGVKAHSPSPPRPRGQVHQAPLLPTVPLLQCSPPKSSVSRVHLKNTRSHRLSDEL